MSIPGLERAIAFTRKDDQSPEVATDGQVDFAVVIEVRGGDSLRGARSGQRLRSRVERAVSVAYQDIHGIRDP